MGLKTFNPIHRGICSNHGRPRAVVPTEKTVFAIVGTTALGRPQHLKYNHFTVLTVARSCVYHAFIVAVSIGSVAGVVCRMI